METYIENRHYKLVPVSEVQTYLDKHWELYGSPVYNVMKNETYQAIVKGEWN